MKVFKYISFILIAFIVVFFLSGFVVPSISYTNEITVNAPPDKCFAVYTDTSQMKKWMPGFVSLHQESNGPDLKGSKWKLILEQEGQRYELTETIREVIANKSFSFKLENAVLTNEANLVLTPRGNETIITVSNKVRGNNIVWRSIFAYYKKGFHEQGQLMYGNLKKVIEATPD